MKKLITITGQTKEWLEGNHGALDFKVRRGCTVVVNLNGKKTQTLQALPDCDSWCRATFTFCRPRIVVPYQIEVFSETEDSIEEIVDALWDTTVDSVTVHNCRSLKSLRFHHVLHFDFPEICNIESLDCDGFRGDVLDFSVLHRLKSLRCQMGESATIELSKSPELVMLDLFGCQVKHLKMNNRVALQDVCLQSCNNLNSRSRSWVEERVKTVGGNILEI